MKQQSNILAILETDFPAEEPTELNPHIPEQNPEQLKEAPTEPNPHIPELEPEKVITPNLAPRY